MSLLSRAQVRLTEMLSKANTNNKSNSKKEVLFGVNIVLRYFIRSFEEAYLTCKDAINYVAESVEWAYNNPMDFLLFIMLYMFLVIVVHSFITSMLRMIGVIKNDDEEEVDDEPTMSKRRRRSYLKPPRKLFVIYEENGEDEEYEVCFESFRKASKNSLSRFSSSNKLSYSDSTDVSNSDTEKDVSEFNPDKKTRFEDFLASTQETGEENLS